MGWTRIIWWAALIAGASYTFADRFDTATPLMIAWKGAGVALLAMWCAVQARTRDGWLIAAVMAAGAAGDVLLEATNLSKGAMMFALGHILAFFLYYRNPRETVTVSQRTLAIATAVFTPAIAWAVSHSAAVVSYTLWLGLMACVAWLSRFPRYRVGIGAMLFVASDLLIFARMGPLAASAWAGFLIWPLYFAGQALIATGVVRTLREAPTA